MTINSNTTSNTPATSTNRSSSTSAIGQGFVATHQGLHSLLNDLLSTVKGLRQQQVQQAERIDVLEKTVEQQKKTIQSLVVAVQDKGRPTDAAVLDPATTTTIASSTTSCAADAAADSEMIKQLRRELVGMIGEALASHEEEMERVLRKIKRLEKRAAQG